MKGDLRLGPKVTVGYYDQNPVRSGSLGKTVIDEIWDRYPNLTQTQIRCALAAFLFRGDDVFQARWPCSAAASGPACCCSG